MHLAMARGAEQGFFRASGAMLVGGRSSNEDVEAVM